MLDIWALELRNRVSVKDVNLGIIIQGVSDFFGCFIFISIIRAPLNFDVSHPKVFENAQGMLSSFTNLSWLSLASAVSSLASDC